MGTETSSAIERPLLRRTADPARRSGAGNPPDILARCWYQLATGRARVGRVYSDASGHHVELVAGQGQPALRDLEILVPVLLGRQQKVVAADARCSASRVATAAARCLRIMGLECQTKDTPMVVVMMAHAFYRPGALRGLSVHRGQAPGERTLVSTSRPDAELDDMLSPCEREVLRCRVDGLSYEDIARVRETAVRTVANQIASAYVKLRISGRLALLGLLLGDGRVAAQGDYFWSGGKVATLGRILESHTQTPAATRLA
jgi:DNA-binding CsgD family transcriptional regulator